MKSKDWETHKPELNRLYIVEGKPQEEVMQIMESTHGFIASKWQYEEQFRKWKFKKNHGGSKTWVYVREKNKRRKIEGKPDGEVTIGGIPQSPGSIATGIRRHAYESTIEKHKMIPLPQTPEGVAVCSPVSSCDWELQWPSDLPWFTFSRQISLGSILDMQSSSSSSKVRQNFWKTPSAQIRRDLFQTLGRAMPSNLTHGSESVLSASRTANILSLMVPEEHEGQHKATAQALTRRTASGFPEISLALYMLSNGIELTNTHTDSGSLHRDESSILRDILRMTKLDNVPSMKNLLSLEGLAAEVLAYKIFKTSIHTMDGEMIRIMLEAGMDPNTPIPYESEPYDVEFGTPLQIVSEETERIASELASLLLSYGASTETTNEFPPALATAVVEGNKELFNILLAHGAKPSSLVLCAAARSLNDVVPYFQALVDAGADLESAVDKERTLLGLANSAELMKWLIDHGLDVNAPQRFTTYLSHPFQKFHHTTSPLGVVAAAGNIACMRVLLDAGADVNLPLDPDPDGAVTPLVLAVENSQTNATKLLLDAGADVQASDECKLLHEPAGGQTLLQRAAKNSELWLPLLRSGAKATLHGRQAMLHVPMLEAVKSHDVATVVSLIALGASVSSCDNESSLSALALAMKNGDIEMISMLKASGASITDSSIPSISNVQTAQFLENAGWLDEILSLNSPSILASAILQRKDALVTFLLEKAASHSQFFVPSRDDEILNPSASPLGSALYVGNLRLAQVLISLGALPNESDVHMMICQPRRHDGWELLNQSCMSPFCSVYIPTAFATALQSDDHSMVNHLLANFFPYGQPVVLFDPIEKRIVTPKAEWCEWDYRGRTWWNETRSPIESLEIFKLDSVLEIAAQNGNRAILQTLLNSNMWTPGEKGQALVKSIQWNRKDLFQCLLASGADLNQKIPGYTYQAAKLAYPTHKRPLEMCFDKECRLKNCTEIRCTILGCCHSNSVNDLESPSLNALVIAMDKGDTQLGKILVESGCDVNADLGHGYSALFFAVRCQDSKFTPLLLQYRASDRTSSRSRTMRDKSALKLAVESENKEIVGLFLNPENLPHSIALYTGAHGQSTLKEAIRTGDPELVTVLLQAGIGLSHQPLSGRYEMRANLLNWAVKGGNVDVLNALLKSGADVNIPPAKLGGRTALQLTVRTNNITMAKLLIDNGANLNLPPAKFLGNTALQVAAKRGNIELVDFLLAKGANINQEAAYYAGGTALQLAAIKGFIGIVRKLLEVGALVDAPGSPFHGRTAIEGAAEWGRSDILYLLLNEGAPPTGSNRRQYIRAVKLAHQRGHYPIVRFLKQWIAWTDFDAECCAGEEFDEEERLKKRKDLQTKFEEHENWEDLEDLEDWDDWEDWEDRGDWEDWEDWGDWESRESREHWENCEDSDSRMTTLEKRPLVGSDGRS